MLSIDVTDKQLKLVRGALKGNKIHINDVETRDVPEECIVNGYITEVAPVAELITKMLADKKITDKEIVVCVNSSSILYKELEVLKPKSLKNTAAIEAMIIAQMGIANDYNVSYSIVGEAVNEEGAAMLKVMATACPQRMVDSYQVLFAQAGLKIKQINISNNCITRLIMNTPKLKETMPFMCIQIDEDFININLYEDGNVVLSRYIKIDPADYDDDPDYVNAAVSDNLFRMTQFIGQRPNSKPLRQIMFYGIIKDFVALSNSIMSFNIPAHVLAMPNSIVKFCKEDFDFSMYANAIGAFYKVDPLLEHVNLLESMAVTSKKGLGAFPMQLLAVVGVSIAVVVGAYFTIGYINNSLVRQTREMDDKIAEARFEDKREEMDLMQSVLRNFSEYKYAVKLAQVMFDFLPRGDLPQIMEQLYAGVSAVAENPQMRGTFYTFDNFVWNSYNITLIVYCSDETFPSDFVGELSKIGFFEDIVYGGFRTIEVSSITNEAARSAIPGGSGSVVEFELSLRLKGGHVFEDGVMYGSQQ
jgi:type IV pilus assembly protein PilM